MSFASLNLWESVQSVDPFILLILSKFFSLLFLWLIVFFVANFCALTGISLFSLPLCLRAFV